MIFFKILSIIIIVMAFDQVNSIAPPSYAEIYNAEEHNGFIRMPTSNKLEFIETKVVMTPEEINGEKEIKFSMWTPNRDINENWIAISKPIILTEEVITRACELMRSL